MVDGIVSFIFFSKSPLWITIGINNFEGLNIRLNIIAHSIEKRAGNKSEQFCLLKDKMGLILK